MRTILTISLLLAAVGCDKTDANKPAPNANATAATPVGTGTISSVGTAAKIASEIPVTSTNAQALEAYKLGFDEFLNAHGDEAREQFKKATALDAKFVTAMAMEGASTPGAEGLKKTADAIALGAALPEAERVHLQLHQAFAARDYVKSVELGKKLTEVAAGAWIAHLLYGRALTTFGKRDEAQVAFKRAAELDPTAGLPYNDMAYNELNTGKQDDAIAHFKRYTELSPKEANAQDSLGEALLMGGKYDEAEGAFKRAIDLNPKFLGAYDGLGLTRLYKGDWAGAFDAFGKMRDQSPMIDGKGSAFRDIVWGQVAQGKPAEAAKTLDAWDAEVAKSKDEAAGVIATLTRASVAIETKKEADGLKILATLGDKIEKIEAPAPRKIAWKSYLRVNELVAESRLGKKTDADKALAATQELLGKSEDADQKGLLALATGEAALAKGDAKAAVDAFAGCALLDDYCRLERAKAQDKSGDKTGAAATREQLQKTHRRDAVSFYAWSKVAPAPASAATAPAPTAADPKK